MKERDLGMNRRITRRDFVGGVAVVISGSVAWCWSEARAPQTSYQRRQVHEDEYPPIRTGMRGSHKGSYEVAHQMRDGVRWNTPEDTGEGYDLVVVGGGLSGLAAAWYYREAEPDARILIIDNHDDFGGHAKRNEFWHGDRMLLSHGGTENIQDLRRYNQAGRRLFEALDIDVEHYPDSTTKRFTGLTGVHSLGIPRGAALDVRWSGCDPIPGAGRPAPEKVHTAFRDGGLDDS